MKIKIKLHPGSSQEKVIERDSFYEVWIKKKPIDGKANKDLEKFLKKYFKKSVIVVSGFKSRNKVVEVGE